MNLTVTIAELFWMHGNTHHDRALLDPHLDSIIDVFLWRAVQEDYIPTHTLASFILFFQFEPRYFRILLYCYGHCNLNPLLERYLWHYMYLNHVLPTYSPFFCDID
jgi:hypothetical protein